MRSVEASARGSGTVATGAGHDIRSVVPSRHDSPRCARVDARSTRGSVVTVWGPGGAPGRTSLAIAIAAELGAAGVYTALGDADTHGASIAPALGLLDEAPGFAAACRLAGAGALSSQEFERIGQFHRASRGGFWVLTGLGRPSRWPELSSERVAGAIAAAREWVDVLVLDTASALEQDEELSSDLAAPRRNAATLEALRAADHVVAVAAADPIGLARFLRMHAELLELTDARKVTVVVNKVRTSAIGPGAASSGAADLVPLRRDRGCGAGALGSRGLRRGDAERPVASGCRPAVRGSGRHPSAGRRATAAGHRSPVQSRSDARSALARLRRWRTASATSSRPSTPSASTGSLTA